MVNGDDTAIAAAVIVAIHAENNNRKFTNSLSYASIQIDSHWLGAATLDRHIRPKLKRISQCSTFDFVLFCVAFFLWQSFSHKRVWFELYFNFVVIAIVIVVVGVC